jgi:hypothetical protein
MCVVMRVVIKKSEGGTGMAEREGVERPPE